MAKQKTAPVASSAQASDGGASTGQQQQQAGSGRPATQLEQLAGLLVPPAWARRIIFVAVIIYLTPMLLAHWVDTSTRIIRFIQSFTSGR
ncbi:hypothetical protein CH63R_02135 [Colletotrichum higginsianum IMI 349063]|uniref:Uncharacterized protein n=2 Tax=Colletotrichum higginsianum TaxID=80884 RepID=A0A1B7YN15_COLHI|nr:hypothetical protein CH63R_02135 [Colletotrichum higginsianum IMI 349063]OBR13409.1 hypothetical protein CH63R_02135 [Colletotrichum higginsianum IMI 349063]TID02342.1 hypothetical protein CH35J_003640 [Colletotrichum higginsianum]GJC95919.1 hypothetical protein ColKHC_04745 [Colletotrichum higginsianum]